MSRFIWKLCHEELTQNIRNVFIKHIKDQLTGNNFISLYRINYKERFITNTGLLVLTELPEFLKTLKSYEIFFQKH